MKQILLVFGTRPEVIKMAPVYNCLVDNKSYHFQPKICITGQHKHMLSDILKLFNMKPDYNLKIMKKDQNLFDVTCNVLNKIKIVLEKEKPDIVLVHGDTTSAMAASLAAFYLGIKIGHVEAGLRTNDIFSPYPEEFNRQIISKIGSYHFVPTKNSQTNLVYEKIKKNRILITGNTVIDSLFWILKKIETDINYKNNICKRINKEISFSWQTEKFVLITGHRRENFGKKFTEICCAIKELAEKYQSIHFVYPVHLNPNVQKPVKTILKNRKNVHLVEPLRYDCFVYLMKFCYLILTDSGGIQEEAPSLGKPVLVMRDKTERPEAVTSGTVILVGSNKSKIVTNVTDLIDNNKKYEKMSKSHNPYGDGKASNRIIKFLESRL